MSLRTRLLLAFAAVVLIPIALVALRLFAKISLAKVRGSRSGSRRSRARC
jgi:hypothetical protein